MVRATLIRQMGVARELLHHVGSAGSSGGARNIYLGKAIIDTCVVCIIHIGVYHTHWVCAIHIGCIVHIFSSKKCV